MDSRVGHVLWNWDASASHLAEMEVDLSAAPSIKAGIMAHRLSQLVSEADDVADLGRPPGLFDDVEDLGRPPGLLDPNPQSSTTTPVVWSSVGSLG